MSQNREWAKTAKARDLVIALDLHLSRARQLAVDTGLGGVLRAELERAEVISEELRERFA